MASTTGAPPAADAPIVGFVKDRHALVVCDAQPEALRAIPAARRPTLLAALRLCIDAVLGDRGGGNGGRVVFSGLRFPPGYSNVARRHRLYGGLRRLHESVGCRFFLEG